MTYYRKLLAPPTKYFFRNIFREEIRLLEDVRHPRNSLKIHHRPHPRFRCLTSPAPAAGEWNRPALAARTRPPASTESRTRARPTTTTRPILIPLARLLPCHFPFQIPLQAWRDPQSPGGRVQTLCPSQCLHYRQIHLRFRKTPTLT